MGKEGYIIHKQVSKGNSKYMFTVPPFIFRENELWVKPWLFFKKKYKTEKIKVERL